MCIIGDITKETMNRLLTRGPAPEFDMVNAALLRNAAERVEKDVDPIKLRFLNENAIPYEKRYMQFHALRNPKVNFAIDLDDAELLKTMAFDYLYETGVRGNATPEPLNFYNLPPNYQDYFKSCASFFMS